MNWLLLSLAVAFALVIGVIAVALGVEAGWAGFVLAGVLAVPLLFDVLLARRTRGEREAGGGLDAPVPLAHLEQDDGRPLGDTPEAHEEISPLDVPPESPVRRAAEEAAGSRSGTTPGH